MRGGAAAPRRLGDEESMLSRDRSGLLRGVHLSCDRGGLLRSEARLVSAHHRKSEVA